MENNKISGRAWILLTTTNVEKAKHFYETVLGQKIEAEVPGEHIVFESGFALQNNYAGIVAGTPDYAPKPTGVTIEIKPKSNSFQLAFEVPNLDYWVEKIKATEGIEILNDVTEYNWGQRSFRFYDYDGHIVELGETMAVVIKRAIEQGVTAEEIAEKWGYSTLEEAKEYLKD